MDFWIILANAAAVCIIFLIAVYLWLDKKRFQVERQFRVVADLFDGWMHCASAIPSCKDGAEAYFKTRNISAKYRAIGNVSQLAWGQETPEMKRIAEELGVFLGVYHALAENYNRRLNSRFTGKVARLLGFKKFPNIQLETDHVQN